MTLRTVQVLRFTAGTTAAAGLAFAVEWPLFFLTPVLTIVFLSSPLPGVRARDWLNMVGYIVGAVALGTVFTLYLLPYPSVYVLMLGLFLFHIYYLLNRGGPFIFVLMCMLAVLILPMLGVADEQLALGFAGYFALSAGLAVVFFALSHAVFPSPPGTPPPPAPTFVPGYSEPAARAALKSTLAVLPLAVLFIALELQGELLVMVFAAIFSLIPDLSKGLAAGRKSFRSTLLGCAAAILVYWLLVAVPEYQFFLALWLLTMLVFARFIFSEHPLAPYMGSAAVAMTILVAGSMAPEADFVDKLVTRVALIALATLYVVVALAVIDRYLFGRTE